MSDANYYTRWATKWEALAALDDAIAENERWVKALDRRLDRIFEGLSELRTEFLQARENSIKKMNALASDRKKVFRWVESQAHWELVGVKKNG